MLTRLTTFGLIGLTTVFLATAATPPDRLPRSACPPAAARPWICPS